MTSETSENTIFVRFYLTLCYLMLTLRNIPNCNREGDDKYLAAISCEQGEDFRQNIDFCWLLIRHPTDKEPISFMVCKKQTSHSRIFFLSYFSSQVLEVVAASRGEDAQSLAEVIYENTLNLFFS